MFASRISDDDPEARPCTRPMPSAKAFSIDRSTANTATSPEMKTLFQSFCGKSTRSQNATMPSK